MDDTSARQQAAETLAAFRRSSRPDLPRGLCVAAALSAGFGVALVGRATEGWAHALTFVVGVALLAGAFALPHLARARSGVHGYRGQVRRENLVFLICAVVLAVIGLGATPALATIYLGLGVVVAVAYFLLLRGRFGAPDLEARD